MRGLDRHGHVEGGAAHQGTELFTDASVEEVVDWVHGHQRRDLEQSLQRAVEPGLEGVRLGQHMHDQLVEKAQRAIEFALMPRASLRPWLRCVMPHHSGPSMGPTQSSRSSSK